MPKSHEVYLHHIDDEIRFLQSLPEFSDVVNVLQNEVPQLAEQLQGLLRGDTPPEGANE